MAALPTPGSVQPLCFDTMCLSYFARAERLDVLRELLVGKECWTTSVVRAEILAGVAGHPRLEAATEIEWMRVATLESLEELKCFVKWTGRIGSGERDLGEASVLAAAELRGGVAVTDDREAARVGRRHGAEVHGTIWLLALACRDGKLTRVAAGGIVDALRAEGARLPCSGNSFPAFAVEHGLLPAE